jgi:hypothetical protein
MFIIINIILIPVGKIIFKKTSDHEIATFMEFKQTFLHSCEFLV